MKYLKSLTLKMCVIAAALFLASPAVAVNSNGRGTKVKTVYQDTDPSATNYLKNRRALVGPGCTVNSVGDGVSVASGLKNLQNLCNDDLDDYATFPSAVEAVVAGTAYPLATFRPSAKVITSPDSICLLFLSLPPKVW